MEKRKQNMCINATELQQFQTLKKDMDDDGVSKDSVNAIVKSILLNRGKFGGIMGKAVFIKFFFLSLFKCFLKRDKTTTKQFKTYMNGNRKFNKELDVVGLLRSVRLSKVLYYSKLNTRQSIMMQLQRTNLVESTDYSEGSDYLELIKDLNHKNKLVRIFALGQVNKTLQGFAKQKKGLSKLDHLLLRGFYTNQRD
jgi:hypothetical protein